jgi:hypothetical protein
MAFRDGDDSDEARAGALAIVNAMGYIEVLAKCWGAK